MRLGAITLAAGMAIATPALAHDVYHATRPARDAIRNAQQALDDLGYALGSVDGTLGPRTRTAIRNFQRDRNLNATGELDDATLEALEKAPGERTDVGRRHTAATDIRHAQETLDDLGYVVGTFDGRLGPRTRTAIRNFQRDKNLNATGDLDEATLDALETASGEAAHATRQRTGAASIRHAQERLDRLGYPIPEADGVLGAETRTAIRNFQRDKGLNATGDLDDETLSALDREAGAATSGTRGR